MTISLRSLYFDDEKKEYSFICRDSKVYDLPLHEPYQLVSFINGWIGINNFYLASDILISLNAKGDPIALYRVTNGDMTYTTFSARITMLYANFSFVDTFIFIHHHTSDTSFPTIEDNKMYQRILNAFKPLELKLKDYILIGSKDFYSFSTKERMLVKPASALFLCSTEYSLAIFSVSSSIMFVVYSPRYSNNATLIVFPAQFQDGYYQTIQAFEHIPFSP